MNWLKLIYLWLVVDKSNMQDDNDN